VSVSVGEGYVGEGYTVDVGALQAHAAAVDKIAADVAECAAAARQVGVGGTEAYGLLLQFLIPPALEVLFGNCSDELEGAAQLGRSMGDALRRNAGLYSAADDANHAVVQQCLPFVGPVAGGR